MLIDIEGVMVDFPFTPYNIQKDYMRQVILALKNKQNAVLESPTGTGKTLCLLTSTLAWLKTKRSDKKYQIAYEKDNMTFDELEKQMFNKKQESWNQNDHKIIYTSRTHSQLAQVMKEMKFTSYNDFMGVALGSRDQLCINDEVMNATSASEKIHLCRTKVKAKQCSYHGNVDRAVEQPRKDTVLDIEDLVKIGKSCGACPYYMAKKIAENADIIFLPYNYILDFRLLKSVQLKLENSVVIFDEAHNVEKVCQDAASYQISSSDIAACIDDITHIMKQLEENRENISIYGNENDEVDISTEDCAIMKQTLLELEIQIDKIDQVTSAGRTFHGTKIFELLKAANIMPETSATIVKLISSLYEYLTLVTAGKPFGRKGFGLAKMMEFLEVVFGYKVGESSNWMSVVETAYRLHVEREEPKRAMPSRSKANNNDGWLSKSSLNTSQSTTSTISPNAKVLNYWCFNPGLGLKGLLNREIHSIILTSGTLSPIRPLIGELDLPVGCQLENSHIIGPSQVFAKIIPAGPDGTPLNAGYQNRDNPKYLQSLAYTIKTVASQTPNGLLVFFPSYVLMNKTQETWKSNGIWDAIHDVKPIFTEPKNKNDFENCMNEYYAAVKTTRGAIFMAVLRGKVSEGLDFKDENGRAVIIIGLPFAPYQDPRVVLKKEYLERSRTRQNMLVSGQEWYNMDATRAVNQAIGRVIRHKDDYGAILLCDQRFANYKSGLSKWIQSHLNASQGNEKFMFGAVVRDLGRFFRAASGAHVDNNNSVSRYVKVEKDMNQSSSSDVRVDTMIKQQIKLENSNEVYSTTSSSSSVQDRKLFEKFTVKQEPTSIFSENINSSTASSIDFNMQPSVESSLQFRQEFSSVQQAPSKKRKYKVTTNTAAAVEPNFVFTMEPVKVKRQILERIAPADRKEFLELIKELFDTPTYKYLLKLLSDYHSQKDWSSFWRRAMPMFKFHPDKIFILTGLRRFLVPEHKRILDDEMKKHFIIE